MGIDRDTSVMAKWYDCAESLSEFGNIWDSTSIDQYCLVIQTVAGVGTVVEKCSGNGRGRFHRTSLGELPRQSRVPGSRSRYC